MIFYLEKLKGDFNLNKKKIDVISLTNWSHVLNVASRKKILKNDEVNIVESFLEKMKVKS